MRIHGSRTLFAVLALLALGTGAAWAQTGTVQGLVKDMQADEPLANARVQVVGANARAAGSGLTNTQGRYLIAGLAPGVYTVVVNMVGYADGRAENVRVAAGQTAGASVSLRATAFNLNPVVVTASRVKEKAIDAPATVAVVDTRAVEARPTLTPVEHVRSIPGVDIITQGLQGTNVVARGFNNIFSTALHTLTDYRIASIPSLRANLLHFIPSNNEDIERVEVVLGPGAALYGPNTANGVVHFLTRSPLDQQGSVVSIAGGERAVFQSNVRTAHKLSDNFAFKLSGQYLQGHEWKFDDPTEYAARIRALPFDPNTKIGLRNYDIQRYGFDGRADWRVTPDMTAVFSAGHTIAASGIELTGIGAGQTDDWKYTYVQARTNYKRFFGQFYLNLSDAGGTYLLRNGLPVTDNSKFWVFQLQHGLSIGERQNFTYGGDLLLTRPDTEGKIHGRNEADDETNETGVYVQSETKLTAKLDLVFAGRVDYHSRLDDPIFSPRAALVFRPVENQSLRATYNRAFSTPVSFNLYLDLDAGPAPGTLGDLLGFRLRAMGTQPNGFTFMNSSGQLTGMRSPFAAGVGKRPADLLPANTETLWPIAVALLQSIGRIDAQTAALLRTMRPTSNDISINALNPNTFKLAPVSPTSVQNVPRIQESLHSQFELGYKGIIREKLLITADAWYEKRTNLTSPIHAVTPLLLLDSTGVHRTVAAGMRARGFPAAQAEGTGAALAAGLKGTPLAVVSSGEVTTGSTADLVLSYRNFGELDLYGADLNATALLSERWSASGGLAWVSDNFFKVEGNFVGLNAPKEKANAALNYRNLDRGLDGELRLRYTGQFPVASAPFNATGCIAQKFDVPISGTVDDCIESAALLDLSLGYRLPFSKATSLQLMVQNVLDKPYQSFAGVPTIKRFSLLRVRHQF